MLSMFTPTSQTTIVYLLHYDFRDIRPPHLSDLFLLCVVPLNHDFALEGATVPVIENPLLGQELGLLLSLGVLHVLLVLGQTLLLLLFGCAVVLVHLLRRGQSSKQRNSGQYGIVGINITAIRYEPMGSIDQL